MESLAQFGKRDILLKIFALSRLVANSETALDVLPQIVNLAREIFIFDNFAIYLADKGELSPYFARAIGRGRSKEADIAWGTEIARRIFEVGETIAKKEELDNSEKNRLFLRYYLGLPLKIVNQRIGVLVFIRFGGPDYEIPEIRVAEFIAEHITRLIERERLVTRVNSLETSRQLEEMQEDFVATVSHDLRTPLGFIKGYTTTLLRDGTEWDKETVREFLEIIDDEADRLRILIDNLLDSSRLQSGTLKMQFQNIRLDIILKDIVNRAKVVDLPVNLHNSCSNVSIHADPMRLAQVFDNLFSNANKYAPNSPVTLSLTKEENTAHIIVQDAGSGIEEEYLDRIFSRFYRVPASKYSARGSGLGLFICRQIIEAHDGEIYVKSTLGEGTAFHIYLPIISEC